MALLRHQPDRTPQFRYPGRPRTVRSRTPETVRRPCALFRPAETPDANRAQLSWAKAVSIVAAMALVVTLASGVFVWRTIVAPLDAAGSIVGDAAAVITPSAAPRTTTEAEHAVRVAQSRLARDRAAAARSMPSNAVSDTPAVTAARAEVSRSFDAWKAARDAAGR